MECLEANQFIKKTQPNTNSKPRPVSTYRSQNKSKNTNTKKDIEPYINPYEINEELLINGFINQFIHKSKLSLSIPQDIHILLIQYYGFKCVCVIHNGSLFINAGFSGDNIPRSIFSTVIGKQKKNVDIKSKKYYIGNETNATKDKLQLTYPIKNGFIVNSTDMHLLWNHTFSAELNRKSNPTHVVLTERASNPKTIREEMTKIMFESFNVKGLYIAITAVLALYATGRVTGTVLDSGYQVSQAVSIYDGYALSHATQTVQFGGENCTDYLMKLLNKKCSVLTTYKDDIIRDIKEKLCYVAWDYAHDYGAKHESSDISAVYELPDGNTVKLDVERFKAPEIFFQPSINDINKIALPKTLWKSILRCDIDIRGDLYSNVIVCGGNTLFKGFGDRFQKELRQLHNGYRINVIEAPKNAAWIGGSILSSLSTFETMWITRKEYNEHGTSIVHRKCF
eukprot:192109_1